MQPKIDTTLLNAGDIARLREDFDYYDQNGNSRIGYDEFKRFLNALDAGMTEDDCRTGFAEIDTDHDGAIEFEEFVNWWGTP